MAEPVDLEATEVRWLEEEAYGSGADRVVNPLTSKRFHDLVARRRAGEPLQYVLGHWAFRRLDLLVDRRVLIPRPETEWVVEQALRRLPDGDVTVLDLGTGSGAIALAIASERWPSAHVLATDASTDALAVARANLAGLGPAATRVELHHGDWWDAVPARLRGELDLVVSNPPYVAPADGLPAEVADWEPVDALVSGPTGLEALGVVVAGAPSWLRPGGWLVCEIGETQGDAVRSLAAAAGLVDVDVLPDLAGRDRVLVARSPIAGTVRVEDPRAFDLAEAVLRDGGALVVPTDTVYGLAALDTELLAELKGRPASMPVAVLVADAEQAATLGAFGLAAEKLVLAFWPGPLTIVVPAGDGATVGVRCPDHDFLRALAARVGPLPTTSANRHGEPTPPTAAEATAALTGAPALVVDGGECGGVASTVVDTTVDPPRVLREGAVAASEVTAALH